MLLFYLIQPHPVFLVLGQQKVFAERLFFPFVERYSQFILFYELVELQMLLLFDLFLPPLLFPTPFMPFLYCDMLHGSLFLPLKFLLLPLLLFICLLLLLQLLEFSADPFLLLIHPSHELFGLFSSFTIAIEVIRV